MWFLTLAFRNEWIFFKMPVDCGWLGLKNWCVTPNSDVILLLFGGENSFLNSFPLSVMRVHEPPNVEYTYCRYAWTTVLSSLLAIGVALG